MLAVSVEIQAAIVGGLISGVVVLVGVVLAEQLRRKWSRHEELRRASLTVALRLPVALAYLTDSPPDNLRLTVGSPGWAIVQEVLTALTEIDNASRARLTRNRAKVREARDEISARLSAGQLRYLTKKDLITSEQLLDLCGVASELTGGT